MQGNRESWSLIAVEAIDSQASRATATWRGWSEAPRGCPTEDPLCRIASACGDGSPVRIFLRDQALQMCKGTFRMSSKPRTFDAALSIERPNCIVTYSGDRSVNATDRL